MNDSARPAHDTPALGLRAVLPGAFPAVRERVVRALAEQGFGILSEIDVQRTLQAKLGVAMEPYLILGACNPGLAHRALDADRSIGLLLPCNVVLREHEAGRVEVNIIDPERMFAVVAEDVRARIPTLADEARTRLTAALATLTAG